MTATTDIQQFDSQLQNLQALASYTGSQIQLQGFLAGLVDPLVLNIILHQSSFVAAGIANFCVAQGVSVPDDGNMTNLVNEISQAFVNFVTGGATGPVGYIQIYSGNPNGHVAGNVGIAGKTAPSIVWDPTEPALWFCTTTGTTATAVWSQIGAGTLWPFYAGTSTGTPNVQLVSLPATVQNFTTGESFWFTVGTGLTNTGSLQITIPAQGQFAGGTFLVYKDGPTGPIPLTGGEVVAGNAPMLKFDGVRLHLAATELGMAALKNTGNTVVDPGTGSLEIASPVSAPTGNTYNYGSANRGCVINRSNGGSPMADTIPAGMVNGWWTEVYNSDTAATLSITAVGCSLNGVNGGSVQLTPGQCASFTADSSGNLWTTVQPVQTVAAIGSPYSFAYQSGFIN